MDFGNWDVAKILQVGFAGLAFLLAFMAYRLLRLESRKERPSQKIIDATTGYMVFALVLSAIAVVSQVYDVTKGPKEPFDGGLARQVQALQQRVDGIRLVAVDAGTSSVYGCGNEQKSEATSLTVMYGLRDGTSCNVQNLNYYKSLRIEIPK